MQQTGQSKHLFITLHFIVSDIWDIELFILMMNLQNEPAFSSIYKCLKINLFSTAPIGARLDISDILLQSSDSINYRKMFTFSFSKKLMQ